MRQELWIDGQRVDLSADTVITLEWVSGLFEDIGSIQMSRSYTIKLPKTARNLRILDDPGNPAHSSSKTRRYLDAQYLRNGVDILGPAKAYVMSVEPESIEVGLLWRVVDGLLEWSESGAKLSGLALPRLAWIGASGTPDYASTREDYLFADYDAGLAGVTYPEVPAATHPVAQFSYLFERIFAQAGVPYRIDSRALSEVYLLASGNLPDLEQELDSGFSASYADPGADLRLLVFSVTTLGWDNMVENDSRFISGDSDTHYVRLRMRNRTPEYSLANNAICVYGYRSEPGGTVSELLARSPFQKDAVGAETCSADMTLEGLDEFDYYDFRYEAPPAPGYGGLEPFDGSVCIRVGRAHDALRPDKSNVFPLAVNLPDMTQTDFVKGAGAMLGLAVMTREGVLVIDSLDNILRDDDAEDWTDKLSEVTRVSGTLDGIAQRNVIKFQEDAWLPSSPDAELLTEDDTLPAQSELFKLPFAATYGNHARHYVVETEEEDGQIVHKLDTVDIKPRVMELRRTSDGENFLISPDNLRGQGLAAAYYKRYQDVIRKPVVIEALVRLNELDLAALDFTRSVYLAQTGQYYAIKSVQADDSDLCKVELIQIA